MSSARAKAVDAVRRTTLVGPDANDLTYLLAWDSMADREKKWNAFFADPEWQKAKGESEVSLKIPRLDTLFNLAANIVFQADGAINAKVSNQFLTPTKFSALQ